MRLYDYDFPPKADRPSVEIATRVEWETPPVQRYWWQTILPLSPIDVSVSLWLSFDAGDQWDGERIVHQQWDGSPPAPQRVWYIEVTGAGRNPARVRTEGPVPQEILDAAASDHAAVRAAVLERLAALCGESSLDRHISDDHVIAWSLHAVGLGEIAAEHYRAGHSYAALRASDVAAILDRLQVRVPTLEMATARHGRDEIVTWRLDWQGTGRTGTRVDGCDSGIRSATQRLAEALSLAAGIEPEFAAWWYGPLEIQRRYHWQEPGGQRRWERDDAQLRAAFAAALPAWRRDVAVALRAMIYGDTWIETKRPGSIWDPAGVLRMGRPLDEYGAPQPAQPVGAAARASDAAEAREAERLARQIRHVPASERALQPYELRLTQALYPGAPRALVARVDSLLADYHRDIQKTRVLP